jgi:hypothetical protein
MALGLYFSLSTSSRTCFFVAGDMSGWSFNARETVEGETPSSLAISFIVTGWAICLFLPHKYKDFLMLNAGIYSLRIDLPVIKSQKKPLKVPNRYSKKGFRKRLRKRLRRFSCV